MRVVVVGAGSLGSFVGGLLARVHDVTLVGRDPHMAAVARDGLRVTGAVTAHVTPAAVTGLPDGFAAELAVVTTKTYDTPGAADTVDRVDVDAVLSLQNGLGNEAVLAAALDAPVLAGVTTAGAVLRDPGHVECTGLGSVTIGPHGDAPQAAAGRAASAFRDAGFDATAVDAAAIRRRRWEKLAVNAGINPVTALAGVPNGALLDGPAAAIADRAAAETAGVARSAGVDLSDDATRAALRDVAQGTAGNTSSMRQDVEAGRRTEVDAITGAVVERATGPVPVNETLLGLVRAWEAERGLR